MGRREVGCMCTDGMDGSVRFRSLASFQFGRIEEFGLELDWSIGKPDGKADTFSEDGFEMANE